MSLQQFAGRLPLSSQGTIYYNLSPCIQSNPGTVIICVRFTFSHYLKCLQFHQNQEFVSLTPSPVVSIST